jgi:subtilisin family serine protease
VPCPLSTTFSYSNTGTGVKADIIDTGIRSTHSEFGGRVVQGTDTVDGGAADDCHGHGTRVAGTVGGGTYGVAKGVTLVAVCVLNCSGSGTTSGVIAGVDWVTANHAAGQPAVANMSLGGGASSSLDTAVQNSIADG